MKHTYCNTINVRIVRGGVGACRGMWAAGAQQSMHETKATVILFQSTTRKPTRQFPEPGLTHISNTNEKSEFPP